MGCDFGGRSMPVEAGCERAAVFFCRFPVRKSVSHNHCLLRLEVVFGKNASDQIHLRFYRNIIKAVHFFEKWKDFGRIENGFNVWTATIARREKLKSSFVECLDRRKNTDVVLSASFFNA